MPPLDDRHVPPGAHARPASRWQAGDPAQWAARHPEAAMFSQPAPYPRRYPPESWTARPAPPVRQAAAYPGGDHPAPAAMSGRTRPASSCPAPDHRDTSHPMPEAPASLIGAVPAVEAYSPPPGFDAAPQARPDQTPPRFARIRRRARAERRAERRADPSPSLLAYRLNRLWLTPIFRRGVTMGLPVLLLAATLALYLGNEERRAAIIGMVADLRAGFEARPEFRVEQMAVRSDSPEVARAIEERLDIGFPVSSFHLDLPQMRARIEALDAVDSAALRIGSNRTLKVTVIEREPAFVWRHRDGLALIDGEGHRVALLSRRATRADLPLIAGDGAPEAVAEARRLLAAAEPLEGRLQALLRVGERRWDLLLEGERRIMLPASGAVTALERVLALDVAPSDLLSRDVAAIDMRNPARPTIRLSQPAMAELHRIRSLE